MNYTKTICTLGILSALFVALSAAMKIPLIGHINTELGYIAFGAALVMFGYYGISVGVIGCIASSLIFSGLFPVGWIAAQIATGLITAAFVGLAYQINLNKPCKIFVSCLGALVGLALGLVVVKTAVECAMFKIPVEVKIVKNAVAFAADSVPMLIGVLIGYKFKTRFESDMRGVKK